MTEIVVEVALPESLTIEIQTTAMAAEAAESAAAAAASAARALTADILVVTASSHVLGPADQTVEMDHAAANQVTIPADADVALPLGRYVNVVQAGTGQTSIVPASGVTLGSLDDCRKIAGRNGGVTLYKRGPNSWWLGGALKA